MPKKDISQLAKFIVDQAIDDAPPVEESARVKAGRKGGLKGGIARSAKLTVEQRAEIARTAAQARWKKTA